MSSSLTRLPKVEAPCPFDESYLKIVRYGCSCGMSQPLCRLYFCRHCLDVRCGFCVSHEVDSHYCPNCFQTMPSAEARLKRHRCANCFDCPICGHTLSTRATSLQTQSVDDPSKVIAKKVYYLACGFCRWTTRDLGLPDQNVASGGWPEPENPGIARFSVLQDFYRTLAQKEKLEKETRRFLGRKLSYMQLSDKYGLSASSARKRAGLPPLGPIRPGTSSGATSLGPISLPEESGSDSMTPAEPYDIDEIEKSPWNQIFDTEENLCEKSRLEQRLWQIDLQSESQNHLYPRQKHLMVKRSQRCRQCEHNLSKPEFNPASIKFKIQLAAYYHIPEIKVMHFPSKDSLAPGQKVTFILKIINPTQHATHIEILDLDSTLTMLEVQREATPKSDKSAAKTEAPATDNEKVVAPASNLLKQPLLIKASDHHKIKPIATFLVPKIEGSHGSKIFLPARDDAAEFDDSAGTADLKGLVDDKVVVVWRKGNKVALSLSAYIPKEVQPSEDCELDVGFGVRFMYTNTVPALEQRDIQKVDVLIPVYVYLGKL